MLSESIASGSQDPEGDSDIMHGNIDLGRSFPMAVTCVDCLDADIIEPSDQTGHVGVHDGKIVSLSGLGSGMGFFHHFKAKGFVGMGLTWHKNIGSSGKSVLSIQTLLTVDHCCGIISSGVSRKERIHVPSSPPPVVQGGVGGGFQTANGRDR